METLERQFNSRVSAFLGRTCMSPTALGMKALGDPGLMRQIAEGRSPSLRTADRVLAFIAAYDGDSGGAQDPPRRRGRWRSSSRTGSTGRSRVKKEQPMERNTNLPARILRLREVESRTGLSRTTIYRWRIAGRFPQAVVLGGRSVGWVEAEVEEWLRERMEKSRGGGKAAAPPTPKRKGTRR